jgi:arabinan endo-1,5-alpha-L-arabinosidase
MKRLSGHIARCLLAGAAAAGLVTAAAPAVATARPTAAAAPPSAAADYPNPGLVTGDTRVHDPSMVRAPDGTYIVVSTGNNLQVLTSTDRIAFRRAGAVWPGGAPWTAPFTGGSSNLWAPDISLRGGRYYLYYSASSFGSRNSAIFLATSPTAMPGTWTDQGIVAQTSDADDYNAIDPNLVVDPSGRWWLTFGSFWTGIKMIRIDPATGKQHTGDRTLYGLARRPSSAGGAVEAPVIVARDGRYYLFVSFDACCRGTSSTYRVMVGRSTSITGPYLDRNGVAMTSGGGTEILATHGTVIGPGHQALMQDIDGWLMAYHYYTSTGSWLGINLVDWSDGWPRLF